MHPPARLGTQPVPPNRGRVTSVISPSAFVPMPEPAGVKMAFPSWSAPYFFLAEQPGTKHVLGEGERFRKRAGELGSASPWSY